MESTSAHAIYCGFYCRCFLFLHRNARILPYHRRKKEQHVSTIIFPFITMCYNTVLFPHRLPATLLVDSTNVALQILVYCSAHGHVNTSISIATIHCLIHEVKMDLKLKYQIALWLQKVQCEELCNLYNFPDTVRVFEWNEMKLN
jgi:hypothetical protein